ncbi:MAG: beta-propeller fold lactonase family protein [Pseudomonadota bacterium]|mgnify:CR=1 FL=1
MSHYSVAIVAVIALGFAAVELKNCSTRDDEVAEKRLELNDVETAAEHSSATTETDPPTIESKRSVGAVGIKFSDAYQPPNVLPAAPGAKLGDALCDDISANGCTLRQMQRRSTLKSLTVTPRLRNLYPGEVTRFVAIGRNSEDTSEELVGDVAWTSSNPLVADVSSEGLVTATAAGKADIIAVFGSLSGAATVQVSALRTVTTPARFAYVVNRWSEKISTYTVDSQTGRLRANGEKSVGVRPIGIASDTEGKYIFVTHSRSGSFSAYAIDGATGALSTLGGDLRAGDLPWGVAIHPSGRFLYVANAGFSNDITIYSFDSAHRSLHLEGTAPAIGKTPVVLSIDTTGLFCIVVYQNSDDVSVYGIDPADGRLTALSAAVKTGAHPRGIAIHPTNKFVYVANTVSNDISIFNLDALHGVLNRVGNNVPAGRSPEGIAVDPTGRFVFVANYASNDLWEYKIDASTGALTKVDETAPAGRGPHAIAIDDSGKYAYVANDLSNDISAYAINPVTGQLTLMESVAAGAGPFAIVLVQGARR